MPSRFIWSQRRDFGAPNAWHVLCYRPLEVSFVAEASVDIDSHLSVHVNALRLRGLRSEILARNIANADTPNYKARDIDFAKELTHAGTPEVLYRTPLGDSLDGNTVELQMEQAAFAENAVHYQTTLAFINSKLRGLMTAITGQ